MPPEDLLRVSLGLSVVLFTCVLILGMVLLRRDRATREITTRLLDDEKKSAGNHAHQLAVLGERLAARIHDGSVIFAAPRFCEGWPRWFVARAGGWKISAAGGICS